MPKELRQKPLTGAGHRQHPGSLRKNSNSSTKREAHEFTRAAKSLKICPRFSACGVLFAPSTSSSATSEAVPYSKRFRRPFLVKQNRDPIHPGRIRRIARIASADGKLANAWIPERKQRTGRQHFRTAFGVGD